MVNIFLDTMITIRLIKKELFEHVVNNPNLKIYFTPHLLHELDIKNKSYIERLKETKTNIIVINMEIDNNYKQTIEKLYKKHKTKNHVGIFRSGHYRKLKDLGEFEVLYFLKELNKDREQYYFISLDKNAKKVFKREMKARTSILEPDQERVILDLMQEQMDLIWNGK